MGIAPGGEGATARGDLTGDLDTIDGLDQPERAPPAAEAPAIARDYPELGTVERAHYAFTREIAMGGMGRVVEMRDRRLGRGVAIKELQPRHRDAARRFEREARITARLQHPSIIHVYEAGTWPGGEPFFAMTLVAGRSLDKVVAECATLDARVALLPHVIAVADALAYAHSQRVVHRDLKPANVLVGAFGDTVVIDWGLAKDLGAVGDPTESLALRGAFADETLSGSVVGTPAYMPPEQARGESVDERADVYALGALLYHVLVGAAPFAGASSRDVLDKVKAGARPRAVRDYEPRVPRDLAAIVDKAMASERSARYADAAELAGDLKRFQTGQLVAAHDYTTGQLVRRWLARYRVATSIAAIAAATLAVAGTVGLRRIVAERDRAELEQAKDELRRRALLEERGRSELQAGRAGPALVYLAGAAHGGASTGARGFLLAEAMRPFEAELRTLSTGPGATVIAVSADGQRIATAGAGALHVWTRDGGEVRTLAAASAVHVVAFDPSGARLAAAADDGVRLVSVADGAALALRGTGAAGVSAVDWRADATRVVTGGRDGRVQLWDAATGERLAASDCEDGPIRSVRFSPDGRRVATGGADGLACVWDFANAVPLHGHRGAVTMVGWTPDGKHVITAGADGTARVWDPELGKLVVAQIQSGGPLAVAVASPDGQYLLTAGADRVARLWALPELDDDHPTPTVAPRLVAELAHNDAIVDAAFSPSGERVATAGTDRVTRVWATATGEPRATFEHADVVDAVRFVGDDRVVTASRDGSVRVWDLARGVERARVALGSRVDAIAVSATGVVAAGREDSRVTMWPAGDPAARKSLGEHLGSVLAVAFAPDGRSLVTAGIDQQALVWDVTTRRRLATLGEPTTDHGPIRAVAFAGDDIALAADAKVTTYTPAGRRVGDRDAGAAITAMAAGGGLVIAATDDLRVHAWSVDAADATPHGDGVVVPARVRALAVAADGRAVALAGESFVHVYAIVDGRIAAAVSPLVLDGPTGVVDGVVFSRDGALIITASSDGLARVWDAANGKQLGARVVHGAATALALAADDATLWIASDDGDVTAFDVHVATGPVDAFAAAHAPWRLGDDDVVVRRFGDAQPVEAR